MQPTQFQAATSILRNLRTATDTGTTALDSIETITEAATAFSRMSLLNHLENTRKKLTASANRSRPIIRKKWTEPKQSSHTSKDGLTTATTKKTSLSKEKPNRNG